MASKFYSLPLLLCYFGRQDAVFAIKAILKFINSMPFLVISIVELNFSFLLTY